MQSVIRVLASQMPEGLGKNACNEKSIWATSAQRLDHHHNPMPGISRWVDQIMESVINPRLYPPNAITIRVNTSSFSNNETSISKPGRGR